MAGRAARRASRTAMLAFLALALPPAAQAREDPLWEAGVGGVALHLPDYRGSSRSRTYALPLPFFVYRGEVFKADREGVRGVLFDSDRVELQLSVGASLPVDSDRSPLREGMESLRPAVEIGPSVEVRLWKSPTTGAKVDLRMPLRAAVTVQSHPQYIGLQFFPHLNVDLEDVPGLKGWNVGMLAGPVFTDRRYNDYFYSVSEADATATRPAYAAKGGYGGMQFILGVSRRIEQWWVGAYVRYDSLRGAAFEPSPLVDSNRYVAGGIGISWVFAQSERKAAPAR